MSDKPRTAATRSMSLEAMGEEIRSRPQKPEFRQPSGIMEAAFASAEVVNPDAPIVKRLIRVMERNAHRGKR